jgi:hypothetical protein
MSQNGNCRHSPIQLFRVLVAENNGNTVEARGQLATVRACFRAFKARLPLDFRVSPDALQNTNRKRTEYSNSGARVLANVERPVAFR